MFVILAILTSCSQSDYVTLHLKQLQPLRAVCTDTLSVNAGMALTTATAYLDKHHSANKVSSFNARSQVSPTCEMVSDTDGTPLYYIVNFRPDNGWVIVSATKCYTPVLAWAPFGTFDSKQSGHTGAKILLEQQKQAIRNAKLQPQRNISLFKKNWDKLLPKIEVASTVPHRMPSNLTPEEQAIYRTADSMAHAFRDEGYDVFWATSILEGSGHYDFDLRYYINLYTSGKWEISTFVVENFEDAPASGPGQFMFCKWDQGYPWNSYCPLVNNVRAPVGCGPVAVGQLMMHHRFPTI